MTDPGLGLVLLAGASRIGEERVALTAREGLGLIARLIGISTSGDIGVSSFSSDSLFLFAMGENDGTGIWGTAVALGGSNT